MKKIEKIVNILDMPREVATNTPRIVITGFDEILIENSGYANISSLKNRLVKEGRLEYKCAKCGISEWQG